MPAIQIDRPAEDGARREALYAGDVLVYSWRPSVEAFAAYAREMAEDAFDPHRPTHAQFDLSVEDYAAVLASFKPKFINSPESKRHVAAVLTEFGCDPEKVYFDVPRIRTMVHGDHLRAGLAYQFHAHRDTWFSAPFQQLNWWLPVYDVVASNTMAFHFEHWAGPIRNSSDSYDYELWKSGGRKAAATQVTSETREQPRAHEPIDQARAIPLVCAVGEVMVFSAAQLHSTVDNRSGWTRFSIDFRTVHIDDLENGIGAPNLDSSCTGTTLGDFMRVSDLAPLPDDLIERYTSRLPTSGA